MPYIFHFFEEFFLTFIPLFVAIDVLGILPIFISLTRDLSKERKNALVSQATLTALAISVVFLCFGKALFNFMGITDNDFRIGGGIVLLLLAISDLTSTHEEDRKSVDSIASSGVVPIGIPLIMGPAALTTILMSLESHGFAVTLSALLVNLFIVWIVFQNSHYIMRILGQAGAKAFVKIASLFLAAIAVMMIRIGLENIIRSLR